MESASGVGNTPGIGPASGDDEVYRSYKRKRHVSTSATIFDLTGVKEEEVRRLFEEEERRSQLPQDTSVEAGSLAGSCPSDCQPSEISDHPRKRLSKMARKPVDFDDTATTTRFVGADMDPSYKSRRSPVPYLNVLSRKRRKIEYDKHVSIPQLSALLAPFSQHSNAWLTI